MIDLLCGDALDILRRPEAQGLNAIVADLPGGGEFMGLAFDHHRGGRGAWIDYWAARLRVAREATERGSWGLFWAFGRTAHWTACALDDAGWEVVRPILHVHGQGWPKARSQLKPAQEVWWLARWGSVTDLQIDRCRVRRSWAERGEAWFRSGHSAKPDAAKIAAPPGVGIQISEGGSWPTDLLLSHCPACRNVGVRKVRGEKPREAKINTGFWSDSAPHTMVLKHGNPDGTETVPAWECLATCSCGLASLFPTGGAPSPCPGCGEERWWACPVAEMDGQSGTASSPNTYTRSVDVAGGITGAKKRAGDLASNFGDSGGASRFFPTFHYDAKASRTERQAGCDSLLWVRDKQAPIGWRRVDRGEWDKAGEKDRATGNVHATIKPIGAGEEDGLMRWLVRLITPPGGRVGDLTAGSGSTGVACQIEGHDFLGCDIDPGAVDIARARLAFWTPERHLRALRDAESLRAAVRETGPDAGPQLDLFGGAP